MFEVPDKTAVGGAALKGLDFFVRHQVTDIFSGNRGRLPYVYDCGGNNVLEWTTNWTTGVCVEALLTGYRFSGREEYLEAAGLAVEYIKSLQALDVRYPRLYGVFREATPQSDAAHPRDALTAAWALLDWHEQTGDVDSLQRVILFADWFIKVAMEKGWPYWTVMFDEKKIWEPTWLGSFHSGGAFFFCRLYEKTGNVKYCDVMRTILDFYNQQHLDSEGKITVICDRKTMASLDGRGTNEWTNPGWEVMHQYNDDFGTLANLMAWRTTGEKSYCSAAERFLQRMIFTQNKDGGFGSDGQSIPSATGAIVIEMLAARLLGMGKLAPEKTIASATEYLTKLQVCKVSSPADGAFIGFDQYYNLRKNIANIRTAAYSIMAMFRYAGAVDPFYFFQEAVDVREQVTNDVLAVQ